eukprot:PhM_4_TR6369/c0_g1_i3/m.100569
MQSTENDVRHHHCRLCDNPIVRHDAVRWVDVADDNTTVYVCDAADAIAASSTRTAAAITLADMMEPTYCGRYVLKAAMCGVCQQAVGSAYVPVSMTNDVEVPTEPPMVTAVSDDGTSSDLVDDEINAITSFSDQQHPIGNISGVLSTSSNAQLLSSQGVLHLNVDAIRT